MTTDLATHATDQHAAPAVFGLADYVSLFAYDGPRRPGILASDLVTWADGAA